ncbi:MAG: 50S ribosomal protein L24 [Peptococcaceae bacterium]|jgi:large subunit ribosomal protein L24|nr:50S ribosomal protein L24 [Peptococcaceae bacterium]
MPRVHVRKGDNVLVVTGKSAGMRGKILRVDPVKSRVVVEGVNIVKRHRRPTRAMPQGGIVEMEAPVHSSNVMLMCGKCNQPTRVGRRFLDDGTKERFCKRCGESIG